MGAKLRFKKRCPPKVDLDEDIYIILMTRNVQSKKERKSWGGIDRGERELCKPDTR